MVMVMSLNQIVELLIDESKSQYTRAITLFEFQTAVYRPNAFDHLIKANEVGLRAPTRILRTARIFAAIKILEEIEVDLSQKRADSVISLRDLAANEDYRSVFDDVIATNGGWTRIRHSQSARTFSHGGQEKRGSSLSRDSGFLVPFFQEPGEHAISRQKESRRRRSGQIRGSNFVRAPNRKKNYNQGSLERISSPSGLCILVAQSTFRLRTSSSRLERICGGAYAPSRGYRCASKLFYRISDRAECLIKARVQKVSTFRSRSGMLNTAATDIKSPHLTDYRFGTAGGDHAIDPATTSQSMPLVQVPAL
jgi:hypothetical protein